MSMSRSKLHSNWWRHVPKVLRKIWTRRRRAQLKKIDPDNHSKLERERDTFNAWDWL